MKKFGFTLAEVLITLGIIGVVAALTAPALTKNTGQAKIGPTLAKFVNTFETATEQYMNDKNIDRLSAEINSADKLGSEMANYIIMTPVTDTYTLKAPNGGTATGFTVPTTRYQLKDGSVAMFVWNNNAGAAKGSYKGIHGRIYYDINGNKSGVDNKTGKDVFAFYVDDSGILIPFGSNAEKYVNKTKASCSSTSSDYTAGFGCTGRVADNAWKAAY